MDLRQDANRVSLDVHLASPRGCCAGVERAIHTVEKALERHGAPIYVRHEIVHNRFVVQRLRKMGARFVQDLNCIPDTDRPVILSAHGAPKSVYAEAKKRQLFIIDATCPLVSKVHNEAEHFSRMGFHIFLIGHRGHPEVIGTLGQLPTGAMTLVESCEEAENVKPENIDRLACISQTTLSVMETAEIIRILRRRFPGLRQPKKSDLCFATTNRQRAVAELAKKVDVFFVLGAENSSNSLRLVEVAKNEECPASLIRNEEDLSIDSIRSLAHQVTGRRLRIGLSASASAPEILVHGVLDYLRENFEIHVTEQDVSQQTMKEEAITFRLPREVRSESGMVGI